MSKEILTKKEVLEKALNLAIERGFKPWFKNWHVEFPDNPQVVEPLDGGELRWHFKEVIFDHDFAKGLWGNDTVPIKGEILGNEVNIALEAPSWAAHLQQMVIAEDPIAYLGEHL